MGKSTVPVAIQAASAQCALQPQKQSRHGQKGEAQGARDIDTRTDVARWPIGEDGEKDSRAGDGDGYGQGEE